MTCVLCPMASGLTDISGSEELYELGQGCPRCQVPLAADGVCPCHVEPVPEPADEDADADAGPEPVVDPREVCARERDARELLHGFGVAILGASHQVVCRLDGCHRPASRTGLCERCYRDARAALMGACSESGCDKTARAKGLCSAHYARHRRATKAAR